MTVLILARHDDIHGSELSTALAFLGEDSIVFNLGLPSTSYRAQWDGRSFSIFDGSSHISDDTFLSARAVALLNLAVDDAPFADVVEPVAAELVAFAAREWREFFSSALMHWRINSAVPWLMEPSAADLHGRKLFLLTQAQEIGLAVPRSLVDTLLDGPRVDALGDDLVGKAINKWQRVSDETFFSTSAIDRSVVDQMLSSAAFVPSWLQQRIRTVAEYRVYYAFGRTLWVRLHSGLPDVVDIRTVPPSELSAERVDTVSSDVDGLLRDLCARMRLSYCAFDVGADVEGLWLFDVNPVGTWHFLARHGCDIAEFIASAIVDVDDI